VTGKTYETLLIETRDRVDYVTMNRPDRLNALNPQLVDDLLDYFQQLYFDRDTRIVVLTGAGRAFCAGLDMKEHRSSNDSVEAGLLVQRRISEIVMRMRRCPQPIVALINGPAAGGGFAFALAADMRIAAEGARMNAAFIKLGISGCDIGVSYFLPRLVGVSLASEMLMTGRFIDAQRAYEAGLLSEVVPPEELMEAGERLVADLRATSPIGLRLTKECLNQSIDAPSLEAAIYMEDRNQILAAQSGALREGIQAFLDKRPPRYEG
jgi:enoyl-CoA hydratase